MPPVIYTETPTGDFQHDIAVVLAIVQKYRPDLSTLVGLLNGEPSKSPGSQPNLRQFFVDVGRIADSLATIAASAPQTLSNTKTILAIQRGEA